MEVVNSKSGIAYNIFYIIKVDSFSGHDSLRQDNDKLMYVPQTCLISSEKSNQRS